MLMIISSFTLIRHPKVFDKLRSEINQACAGKTQLDRNDLRKMTYLQNVIKESESVLISPIILY